MGKIPIYAISMPVLSILTVLTINPQAVQQIRKEILECLAKFQLAVH